MAQNRVSVFRRVWKFFVESARRFEKVEEVVTEETDGKDSFYYVRTVARCSHCDCSLETQKTSKILLKQDYEAHKCES